MITHSQVTHYQQNGYIVIKGIASSEQTQPMLTLALAHLKALAEPVELETDVKYPGAPTSKESTGGNTVRRLLNAYDRAPLFAEWAHNTELTQIVLTLLGSKELWLTRNHHNTVMTKQPSYSSDTLWHRDTRYWHFSDHHLVNAWLALTQESANNGGMKVIPGSHLWEPDTAGLDDLQFLNRSYPGNQQQLAKAIDITLDIGDLLLFSPYLFHAASRNKTQQMKSSLVYTYHGEGTVPLANTKSSKLSDIRVL